MKKILFVLFSVCLLGTLLTGCKTKSEQKSSVEIHSESTMYTCAMHPSYISDKPGTCPFCGMGLVPLKKSAATSIGEASSHPAIQINPLTIQNMGVKTEVVRERALTTDLRASGIIKADESRITMVTARVMGYVKNLRVTVTGQSVKKNTPLLEIYSPDLIATQEEFLQSLKFESTIPDTDSNVQATHANPYSQSARKRLLNWGVSEKEIDQIEKTNTVKNSLALMSEHDGVVLEKMVVEGQNVSPGMPLFRLADLNQVWVVANIYQADLAQVKVGTEASISMDYLPGKSLLGKVQFISPVLDEQTKTLEVRIAVINTPALDLKPQMFASVHFQNKTNKNGVMIPEQSVIRTGKRNLVIVSLGQGYFEPREILLGITSGNYVEVTQGIKTGETIVVSSQFLIDSESNLNAAIQKMQSSQK